METITFINEDTIRYKYYYYGNEKWKANRCTKLSVKHAMNIFTIRRRELFYNFLVTSDLKWKWRLCDQMYEIVLCA